MSQKPCNKGAPRKNPVLVKILDDQKERYLRNHPREFSVSYVAPQTMRDVDVCFVPISESQVDGDRDCSICLDRLCGHGLVRMKLCKHAFHDTCIKMVIKTYRKCPLCRSLFKEPRGTSPSGNLSIVFDPALTCAGFSPGTIKLGYAIPWGVEKRHHVERGKCFAGNIRVAYVPDTVEGRQLLRRLVYAFLHGLTFRLDMSLTAGRPNIVAWGSIPHKTVTTPGPYGFPDSTFFENCHKQLDEAGVPESSACHLRETDDMDRYIQWRERFD